MNLQDRVDIDAVIEAAFSHPAMRVSPRSTRRPDLDTALKAVVDAIQDHVANSVAQEVKTELSDKMEFYEIMNGSYKSASDKNAWECGADDIAEAAAEPYSEHLSADWSGKNLIGTDLHLEGGLDKFCMRLGLEFYKNITRGIAAAKVMAEVGITTEQVSAQLARHNNITKQELNDMGKKIEDSLEGVMDKIAQRVGADYDSLTVYDDFDLASDSDDGLAMGAGARLGIEGTEVQLLQDERMFHGADVAQNLLDALDEAISRAAVASEQAEAAPKSRKKVKEAAPKPEREKFLPAQIDPAVFQSLKDIGVKDDDMAKKMGVSRPTYNNWVNGKTGCVPTPNQSGALRELIVDKVNTLLQSLALLDDTEAQVIF